MKRFERILTHLLATGLVAGMALNFSACSKDSPIGPDNIDTPLEQEFQIVSLGQGMPSLAKRISVTKRITSKHGGKLVLKHKWTSSNGNKVEIKVALEIQKDGISEDAELSLTLDDEQFLGNLDLVFGPHGIVFDKAAELSIKAKGLDLSDFDEKSFGLYYDTEDGKWEKMTWKKLSVNIRRGEIEIVKAKLPHFSRYALAAQ